jgi:hypothetical protein
MLEKAEKAILNMDNPETQETLRIRHRTNTNNTKKNITPNITKISNTDTTVNPGGELGCSRAPRTPQ